MTDFRALCAELVDELEDWIAFGDEADCADAHALVDSARAALTQPEPQEQVLARVVLKEEGINYPSDVVLRQYCDDWFNSDPERTEVDPVDLCRGAIRLFAHGAVTQPEPQGATVMEIIELHDWLEAEWRANNDGEDLPVVDFARAVLARFGNHS
jgi:hypothetical protein